MTAVTGNVALGVKAIAPHHKSRNPDGRFIVDASARPQNSNLFRPDAPCPAQGFEDRRPPRMTSR
jgi:hypothetical protein